MDAILQMIFSDAFLWMKSFVFWLKFHWSLFLRVQLTNNPALFKIMAWCRIGDKPLSEPMLAQFTDHIYVALGGDELTIVQKSCNVVSSSFAQTYLWTAWCDWYALIQFGCFSKWFILCLIFLFCCDKHMYICIWSSWQICLALSGPNKMAAILQTTFWNTFSWMKIVDSNSIGICSKGTN